MSAAHAGRLRHDLRTPVNHILGYAELLMEDAEAAGRPDRMVPLARIRSAARELIALIDSVSPDRLRPALDEPARRVLAEVEHLAALGPPVGPGDAADLARIGDAARRLLELADIATGTSGVDPGRGEPEPAGARDLSPLGGRVLVVDDDPGNREMLRRRLEREGCAVTAAAGGADALALLESGGVDLILLDVLMPGMSGEEVLRRLKADLRHRELPVLMISALDEQDAVVRCIEIGAEDYLPKGVDPVLLRARLGACLRKKRARDAELEYLRHVRLLTGAAAALQGGAPEIAAVDEIAARDDALGNLARVFAGMAREVRSRELRLAAQVAELRVEIDETRKARAVSAIVESDAFRDLQRRAAELRRPHLAR